MRPIISVFLWLGARTRSTNTSQVSLRGWPRTPQMSLENQCLPKTECANWANERTAGVFPQMGHEFCKWALEFVADLRKETCQTRREWHLWQSVIGSANRGIERNGEACKRMTRESQTKRRENGTWERMAHETRTAWYAHMCETPTHAREWYA